MKAFVMKTIGQVGFMEKPIPHPGPDDAIVKTTRALICTSDSHTVGGAVGPRENLTLGHEAVGIVHVVGSNVKLSSPVIGCWLAPSPRIGAIPPRKLVTPLNLVPLWEDGNSPIRRMACL